MSSDKKLERLIRTDCLTALLYYRHTLCSSAECMETTNLKRCGSCMDRYLLQAAESGEDAETEQAARLFRDWRKQHSD